ncbi:hypothetical protein [Streptomyces tritici]|uniref:hypothetical protein n=1 Tax=Streptomyces tritici TaxID=2054410 RepID=UPI003AF0A056
MPKGYETFELDEVVVIRRLDATTGELAWMPDGRTFCYAMVRKDCRPLTCGRVPEEPPAPGLLFTIPLDHDRVTSEEEKDQLRLLSFAMSEGGSRNFDHV